MGDGEGGAGVTIGDGDGVVECGVVGDGLDKKEVGAGEGAGLGGVCGALELAEVGQADESDEGYPIAGRRRGVFFRGELRWIFGWGVGGPRVRLDGEDGAEAKGTKGAGAKGAQGIEGGDDGAGVLEDEASGGRQGEHRAQCAVDGFDLDFAVAREGVWALEREGQVRGEREVVGVGEANDAARDGGRGFADEADGRPGSRDDEGDGKGAAILEDDLRGEMVSGVRGGVRDDGSEAELQRVRRCIFRRGGGAEDEVAEGELADLAQA